MLRYDHTQFTVVKEIKVSNGLPLPGLLLNKANLSNAIMEWKQSAAPALSLIHTLSVRPMDGA